MTCRELVEFLSEYLGESLPAEQRGAFESHLSDCQECRAYLSSFQATIRLGKSSFCRTDDRIPGDVPEELVRAVLAARLAER